MPKHMHVMSIMLVTRASRARTRAQRVDGARDRGQRCFALGLPTLGMTRPVVQLLAIGSGGAGEGGTRAAGWRKMRRVARVGECAKEEHRRGAER
jgi:hypothetical protein